MSRQQRPRQIDYSKPLTKIENVDAFVNLEPTVDGYNKVLEIVKTFQSKENTKKIPVPLNDNEKKPTEKIVEVNGEAEKLGLQLQSCKFIQYNNIQTKEQLIKKRKGQIDYIRVLEKETLPRSDIYEATYEDIQFIQTKLAKKVKLDENGSSSSQKLSATVFEQIILAWEMESDKVEIVDFQKAKMLILDKFDKNMINYIQELYDYWKKQREILGRPLLRKHLKPAPNDSNPNIAFRPREKEKIKTRRNIRSNDNENIDKFKQLKQELINCKYMIECIKCRENLKADIWEANNILKFEQARYEKEEKGKIDNALVKSFQEKSKKHLEELKKLQKKQNLQAFKFEEPLAQEIIHSSTPQTDENYDLGTFLASIIIEADNQKINQDHLEKMLGKFTTQTSDTIIKIPSHMNAPSSLVMPESQIFHNPIPEEKKTEAASMLNNLGSLLGTKHWHQKKQNCIRFQLRKRYNRCKILLIDRYFQEDVTYPYHEIPQKFELNSTLQDQQLLLKSKWKRFSQIYEHSDSTEEEFNETVKSLKKSISLGFKNFLKQKNKTVVAKISQFHT